MSLRAPVARIDEPPVPAELRQDSRIEALSVGRLYPYAPRAVVMGHVSPRIPPAFS